MNEAFVSILTLKAQLSDLPHIYSFAGDEPLEQGFDTTLIHSDVCCESKGGS